MSHSFALVTARQLCLACHDLLIGRLGDCMPAAVCDVPTADHTIRMFSVWAAALSLLLSLIP